MVIRYLDYNFRTPIVLIFLFVLLAAPNRALAEPIARDAPISGKIIAKKSGETARLAPEDTVYSAEVLQKLKMGDVLRTNSAGTLAIVFADGTQIRLGRNSTLLVKAVTARTPSRVQLQNGSIWGRSPRSQSQLTVETPAASASIRGTSWTLEVDEQKTVLNVYEGSIDFFNDFGQIEVSTGQSASAEKGKAPSRLFVVNPDEQRQMAHYIPASDMLRYIEFPDQDDAGRRARYERVLALPPEQRNAGDWLELAKVGSEYESANARLEAVKKAHLLGLSPSSQAEAILVEGLIETERGRVVAAISLIEAALPNIDGELKEIGHYALYLNRSSQADPDNPPPLSPHFRKNSKAALIGLAFVAAYRGDLENALSLVETGELLFPNAIMFPKLRGNIALLTGNPQLLESAVQAGELIDADDPGILMLLAQLKIDYRNDYEAALINALKATRLAPGNSLAWNVLGLTYARADKDLLAKKAYLRGLGVNPEDPVVHANLAVTMLDLNRPDTALAHIETALQLDPSQSIVRSVMGRYLIQQGRGSEAVEELLAASAVNPNYAQTSLLLAHQYHNLGKKELAEQQLDNASTFDPNSPMPPLFRSLFSQRSDSREALPFAIDAYHKQQGSGGAVSNNPASQLALRNIANVHEKQGLDRWATMHRENAFMPSNGAAYFDRAAIDRPTPFVVIPGQSYANEFPEPPAAGFAAVFDGISISEIDLNGLTPHSGANTIALSPPGNGPDDDRLSNILQGLALSPLAIASPRQTLSLFNEHFLEASGSVSTIARDGMFDIGISAGVGGLVDIGVPLAFRFGANRLNYSGTTGPNDKQRYISSDFAFGTELSSRDNFAVVAKYSKNHFQTPLSGIMPRQNGVHDSENYSVLGLYAHEFSTGVLLKVAGEASQTQSRIERRDVLLLEDPFFNPAAPSVLAQSNVNYRLKGRYASGSIFIPFAFGSWTVGSDYQKRYTNTSLTETSISDPAISPISESGSATATRQRSFQHLELGIARNISLEQFLALNNIRNEDGNTERLEYGIAVSYEFAEHEAIRIAYLNNVKSSASFSFLPSRLGGLAPDWTPSDINARMKSLKVAWERQWSDSFFSSIEYQLQDIASLSAVAPSILGDIVNSLNNMDVFVYAPRGPVTKSVGTGEFQNLRFQANAVLTHSIALDAVYTYSDINGLSYLPKHSAFANLNVDLAAGIKMHLSGQYASARAAGFGERPLKSFLVSNIGLAWHSQNHRTSAKLELSNMFDERVEVYSGYTPYGRTALATFSLTM